ncbi:MAG: Gfo/Idh/MocA family oxidoreductase [Verrucomicrobia bacterium]|jgi:1,5-anhydro-D-fructose reductase (1,5-anhydro-D-mannitol-forming)|nr:Gfo/Idh/MocA family oxidoreductase [Verrucomicrobiota bacterium]
MIRVGVIGLGFMGGVHLRNWQARSDAEVVAVCDAILPVAGDSKQGNLDVGGESLDLEGIATYTDAAEMFAAESLDAVSIALPTHLHRPIAIQALEAGTHVLCEKPMALNVEDCDAMIVAAKKAERLLMIAHCIRFWPEYVWLKQVIDSGEYGKLRAAEFQRLSAAPGWDSNSWFADVSKSGGIALDLHIHDLDFIQYCFGEPVQARAACSRFDNDVPGHVQTWLDYGNNAAISATGSWMMPKSFGFKMSYSAVFETAAAFFEGRGVKVFPAEGEPFTVEVDGDGYAAEIEHFAKLVGGQERTMVVTPEDARESVRMALEVTEQ